MVLQKNISGYRRVQMFNHTSYILLKKPLIVRAVGGAWAGKPTCKLRTFLIIPLTLTEPMFNNFQENGFSVENSQSLTNFYIFLCLYPY